MVYQKIFQTYIFCMLTMMSAPVFGLTVPTPPDIKATSYVLMDYNSGQIIASSNMHQKVEPASLTKMMTMYALDYDLANGRVQLTDNIYISAKARNAQGSRMYVEQNTYVPLDQIIKGIIIQSGNDASIALAEHLGGNEETFAQLMNFHAKNLGMNDSCFKNATGLLEEGHVTSAYDMAILARALIKEFPDSYHLYSQKSFKYNNIDQPNRNRLLWENPFVDGIKTGYTDTAGYCLAASAIKDNTRLISIVMGTDSDKTRTFESIRLLSYGFRFFESVKLHEAAIPLTTEKVWFGDRKNVEIKVNQDIYVSVPAHQQKNLKADLYIKEKLIAPIKTDQQLGSVRIYLGDEIIHQEPVYASTSVKKGGAFSRVIDKLSIFITRIFPKINDEKDVR